MGQKARAHAGGMAVAALGDHRHPHPHRFEGGGGAVVEDGIEADVDMAVSGQMLDRVGIGIQQDQAVAGHAVLGEFADDMQAQHLVAQPEALDQQTRLGHAEQQAGPQGEGGVGDLGRIVERAEDHRAVGGGLAHRRRRRVRRRPIAQKAAGQPQQGLAGQRVGRAGRIGDLVDDTVIDGGQAGGVGVAEPGHLHRRRPQGERAHPIGRRMSGQVDQRVDVVGADPMGEFEVAQPHRLDPVIGGGADLGRHLVAFQHVGIAENLELRAIDGRQQRTHKIADRMIAEIRRAEADPVPSLAPRRHRRQAQRLSGRVEQRADAPVFARAGLDRPAVAIIEVEQHPAPMFGRGRQFGGAQIVRHGDIGFAASGEDDAEIAVRGGQVGVDLHGATQHVHDRVGVLHVAAQHDRAEIAVGGGIVRAEHDGDIEPQCGFRRAVERGQGGREIGMDLGRARVDAGGALETVQRLVDAAEGPVRTAEIGQHGGVLGQQSGRLFERQGGLAMAAGLDEARAQMVENRAVARIYFGGATQILDRFTGQAGIHHRQSGADQQVGEYGAAFDRLAIKRDGGGGFALLVQRQRFFEQGNAFRDHGAYQMYRRAWRKARRA